MADVARGYGYGITSVFILSTLYLLYSVEVFCSGLDVEAHVSDQAWSRAQNESIVISEGTPVDDHQEAISSSNHAQENSSSGSEESRGGSASEHETGRTSSLPRYHQRLLQYHLKRSTHSPVCVLFTDRGPTSEFEEKLSVLWSKLSSYEPYREWQTGVYLTTAGPLRNFPFPESLPSLRCYVGTAVPEDYISKPRLQKLMKWFKILAHKYRSRITEADIESLRAAVADETKLTIVAFPGEAQHYEIEWFLLECKAAHQDHLQLFVVHPNSKNKSALQQRFSVEVEPTILVLVKGDPRLRVWHRFGGAFVTKQHIEPFILAQISAATVLTLHNFQQEIFNRDKKAQPILVCFYAHWGQDTVAYLHTFQESVSTFKELGTRLRFGTVDVESEKDIVPRWITAAGIKGFPFSILFWWEWRKDKGQALRQIPLPPGVPTPWVLGSFLVSSGIKVEDSEGGLFHYSPWRESFGMEASMGVSSVVAPVCSTAANISSSGGADVWGEAPPSDNESEQSVIAEMVDEQDEETGESKENGRNWNRGQQMWFEETPRVPAQIGSIPRVTDATWPHVVEQSHAVPARDGLQQLTKIDKRSNRKDTPKTILVFFIQGGCGSCRRQQGMFERVSKAVRFVAGGSAYTMNCTSDPETCARLQVRGFPTVIAFRSFGQHSSERCLSRDHHTHTLRMDFHGVLEERHIMEWFSDVAIPRVQVVSRADIEQEQKHNDAIVLATIYPRSVAGQYLRAVAGSESWYPLECFQVACERLYGKAVCRAVYGDNIKPADLLRTKSEERLIISKVQMLRRDGVTSKIFTNGRTLIAAMRDEADSQIHQFHSPHRYKLRSGQRCEDDHPACTNLITDFVRDHSRLPVTHLTVTSFHAYSSVGFDTKHQGSVFKSGLPVVVALARSEDMEEGSQFWEALQGAAYDMYQDLVFAWVDVEEFPRWVIKFVPIHYQKLILEHEDQMTDEYLPSLFVYPRLCIVRPDDHRRAALFPSVEGFSVLSKLAGRTINKDDIVTFARKFLQDPEALLIHTEHF